MKANRVSIIGSKRLNVFHPKTLNKKRERPIVKQEEKGVYFALFQDNNARFYQAH